MNNRLSNKSWHLISVDIAVDVEDMASLILFDLGATGIVTLEEDEKILTLGAYFDDRSNAEELTSQIESEFARIGILNSLNRISYSNIPDQDWMQKWKEGFKPLTIGKQMLIAPSWELPEDAEGRLVIQIDPGMAFGTGTHETTRLCLEAIEKYWRGKTMIDVGTGTGILAIGAALLVNDSHITAIDIDPLAVSIAKENILINRVEKIIEVREAQPDIFTGCAFDMVVANLTAEVIIALMPDLIACLSAAGVMILSGILTELREDVEQCLIQAGLKTIEHSEAGEWSLLVARRGKA
jgi:ribosomal protein L11 methyltransferase